MDICKAVSYAKPMPCESCGREGAKDIMNEGEVGIRVANERVGESVLKAALLGGEVVRERRRGNKKYVQTSGI